VAAARAGATISRRALSRVCELIEDRLERGVSLDDLPRKPARADSTSRAPSARRWACRRIAT
jgi:hypothetical protein